MADAHASVVDLSRLDREALEALVVAQQEKLLTRNSEIEHLKLIIAKLRRMMFGTKSEKIAREVEQLELKLEELETGEAACPPAAAPTSSTPRRKRKRRPLPEHLPRETHTHMPAEEACSACGGQLCKLGEDVSEMLEYIPASFKVIRHVRPKMCCTRCDAIVQAPAPSRPIDRGLAGPGLLAHVLVSKNNGSVMYCSWFHLRIAYSSEWAVMDVYKNGKKIDTMYPERRFYKASEQTSTIVANRSRPNADLYLVYTGKNPDTGKPIIKAHVNPLVMWIWIGVVVVGFGTVITLIPNWKPPKVRAAEKEREDTEAAARRGAVEVGGD